MLAARARWWPAQQLAQNQEGPDVDLNSKLGRLLAKIADNIVVTVDNVHIRLEDTLSGQPSWCGVRCVLLGGRFDWDLPM
jgi:hypothetical protein